MRISDWSSDGALPSYRRQNRGIDTTALLADARLHSALLAASDALIAFAPIHQLVQRAIAITGSPWLGLELGASAHAFSHGAVGYAAVASGSVREALDTVCRFAAIRTRAVHFELRRDRNGNGLHIVERSEEHTSELQSLMRISYAVFCLKKKNHTNTL